jgi:hypothetical protein
MKPFRRRRRLKIQKDRTKKEEIPMKIRTKLAIFALAAILSLAGFGVLANALSMDRILAAAQPLTHVGVTITG